MDFAEFMEIMRTIGKMLSEFLGMDVSRFGRTFIVSFIILLILTKISFKIFDRTMFDRSDPSNVRRLLIDLGLEVKPIIKYGPVMNRPNIGIREQVRPCVYGIPTCLIMINSTFKAGRRSALTLQNICSILGGMICGRDLQQLRSYYANNRKELCP